jgi:hypothetical protein
VVLGDELPALIKGLLWVDEMGGRRASRAAAPDLALYGRDVIRFRVADAESGRVTAASVDGTRSASTPRKEPRPRTGWCSTTGRGAIRDTPAAPPRTRLEGRRGRRPDRGSLHDGDLRLLAGGFDTLP